VSRTIAILRRLDLGDPDAPIGRNSKLYAGAIFLVWLACAIGVSIRRPTIGLSDMFGFISRAELLSLDAATSWGDGYYPFGYPLLLRIVFEYTGDYVLAGRLLSLAFASLGLYLIYRIGTRAFSASAGLLAMAFCSASPIYIRYATLSGSDMPAAILLLASILLLCRHAEEAAGTVLFAAGAAIGASYLIRYTALTIYPAVVLWLLLRPVEDLDWRSRTQSALVFSLGLLAIAAPQLVVSQWVHGNPLYNLQARNVYFGLFGSQNWGLNMSAALPATSIVQLVLEFPIEFAQNWFSNLVRSLTVFIRAYPVHLIAFPALLFTLANLRTRSIGFLFALTAGSFTAAIAMAFVNSRLLLFSSLLLIVVAGYGADRFVSQLLRRPLRAFALSALTSALALRYLLPIVVHPLDDYNRTVIRVSRALDDWGMTESSQVLSFSFDYYNLNDPTKKRFEIPWYGRNFVPYQSVDDVASRMSEAGQRFLVFDSKAPQNVPGLEEIWPFDGNELERRFRPAASFPGATHVFALRET